MKKKDLHALIRNLAIEMVVYSGLVLLYSVVALRWLSEPLCRLFNNSLVAHAVLSLGLIVAQGALLDVVTAFLLDQLLLERLE